MTISNLTDENTGRYRCVAYNLGGHRYTIVHVRMKCKMKYFVFFQFCLLSKVYTVLNSLLSYQREKQDRENFPDRSMIKRDFTILHCS